jgi:hypothetical protein
MAGQYVAAATGANISLTTLFAGIAAASNKGQEIIGRTIGGDLDRQLRLAKAGTRATLLEVDVYGAHYDRLRAAAENDPASTTARRVASFVASSMLERCIPGVAFKTAL